MKVHHSAHSASRCEREALCYSPQTCGTAAERTGPRRLAKSSTHSTRAGCCAAMAHWAVRTVPAFPRANAGSQIAQMVVATRELALGRGDE